MKNKKRITNCLLFNKPIRITIDDEHENWLIYGFEFGNYGKELSTLESYVDYLAACAIWEKTGGEIYGSSWIKDNIEYDLNDPLVEEYINNARRELKLSGYIYQGEGFHRGWRTYDGLIITQTDYKDIQRMAKYTGLCLNVPGISDLKMNNNF